MKKHSIREFFWDIAGIFYIRMKLIFSDTATVAALISSILIFAMLIHVLTASADTQSAIPVGIVDYDRSEESEKLVARVSKVPALRVVQKSEKELHRLLLDQMVNAVFIINDGYEEKIKKGDIKEIITMYYAAKNKSASIISDIVVGEMIYPVSLYKSLNYYQGISFDGKKHTLQEYEAYVKSLLTDSDDFNFAFNMIYENPEKTVVKDDPFTNALLYDQLIFGILGILTAFIVMFLISGIVKDKEIGVEDRLRISKYHYIKRDIGNISAVIVTGGIIALVFSLMVYRQLKLCGCKLFLSSYLLIMLNAFVLGSVFILIAKMVRSMIVYQLLGTTLILITGGLGFYQLLNGFYQVISGSIIKIIPNSWFIQGFTDIIVYGREGGYLKEGHRMLALQAALLIFLILVFNLTGEKTGLKYGKPRENAG